MIKLTYSDLGVEEAVSYRQSLSFLIYFEELSSVNGDDISLAANNYRMEIVGLEVH